MQKRILCAVTNLTTPLQADLREAKARSLQTEDDPPLGDGSSRGSQSLSHCSKSDQNNITKYVFAILLSLPQGVM